MSKSSTIMNKYLGYKFYKENEDGSFDIIRIVKLYEFNDKVLIRNEETGKEKAVTFASLKSYTPLKPTGMITFSEVKIYDNNDKRLFSKDVIVCLYRMIDIQLDQNIPPYAICRQNINDIFYNLLADKEQHDIVGLSITRDNCPTNFDYRMMAACDEIVNYQMVNIYLDDTLDDILYCINIDIYDNVLYDNFASHMKHKNIMWSKEVDEKSENKVMSDNGWCRNLKTLLLDNNFITDLNTMRNITALDFDLSEDILSKEENTDEGTFERSYLSDECMRYMSYVFKVNMNSTLVVKYDYDVDIADFNHGNYTLVMDNTNTLYIIVYTVDGEYIEKDLEDEANKLDFSTRYRLAFYNKYN